MRYFSLFTGIGGLDYGLNGELVGWSEIKKGSIKVFGKKVKAENYGDIKKMNYRELPDFDMLLGGFPCQSFSLVGTRKGFEDKKGQMIFDIYNLLKEKKPDYFVLENVKGILSHDNGKTYLNVHKLLKYAGYCVRVLLLNSCWFGSAQSRERVFFIGSRNYFDEKEVVKVDNSKRFRDIRDNDESNYKFIKLTDRVWNKINQKRKFNFELVGGYDRVGTLTTQYGCGEKLVQEGDEWRILTVKECERLQGFPESWTEGVSDNQRYWMLGNAVNCNVSDYLFNDYLKGLWY